MTDLRQGSSGLTIAEDITGSIYIRNRMGNLIVEFNKQFSKAITLSLDPGVYELTIEQGNDIFVTSIELTDNKISFVNTGNFRKIDKVTGVQRGNADVNVTQNGKPVLLPLVFSVFPPLSTAGLNLKINTGLLIGLFAGATENLNGCAISSLGNLILKDSKGS
ncbi:MAG: hypothetical protein GX640_11155 [Fibrobacter sp.]|nr:hypothetical protein [Fibrobacter sp.]